MYSSRYSQVKKFNPEAQKKMQYRSKGKSCGYYVRIIFFFSSLIQSLIIVSLVLFLIYGKTQASASSAGVQDLEESFSRLSIENVALRHQRKNLTNLLNTTLTEKARNDWDLVNLRGLANRSITMFQFYDVQLVVRCYHTATDLAVILVSPARDMQDLAQVSKSIWLHSDKQSSPTELLGGNVSNYAYQWWTEKLS
ncbi:hypothetical protein XENOCAPTIV_026688 [Xenoophorus captivus]|uniref:Uncharacterized protein n=1 Tax=Xenoophorus captivus TaxID=1517983 RepID=A0ABV0R4Z4_9TELE